MVIPVDPDSEYIYGSGVSALSFGREWQTYSVTCSFIHHVRKKGPQ